jgi:hypothetical protein
MGSNWLPGEPYFVKNLMITRQYEPGIDDTKFYEVYTYPELEYLGKYYSSRFDKHHILHETYPDIISPLVGDAQGNNLRDVIFEEGFRAWRDLFPHCTNPQQWYQIIGYTFPDLKVTSVDGYPSTVAFDHSIVKGSITPFAQIVEQIKAKHNIYK